LPGRALNSEAKLLSVSLCPLGAGASLGVARLGGRLALGFGV